MTEDYVSGIHKAAIDELTYIRKNNQNLTNKLQNLVNESKKVLSNARNLSPKELESLVISIQESEKLLIELTKKRQ